MDAAPAVVVTWGATPALTFPTESVPIELCVLPLPLEIPVLLSLMELLIFPDTTQTPVPHKPLVLPVLLGPLELPPCPRC